MFARIAILTLVTFGLIVLDYKKNVNLKKSLIALLIYIFILALGYSGYILMRVVVPVMFIHFIFLIASYFALIWYLFKNKLYWQVVILPIFTFVFYFLLDFIEGSRYEV